MLSKTTLPKDIRESNVCIPVEVPVDIEEARQCWDLCFHQTLVGVVTSPTSLTLPTLTQ